jgi:nicotinate-nucleotide adenylyltransferase
MRQGFPYAAAGQVIGLLGGSFDPPHQGHAHITREALKRFGLDQVWWLVSPGNPLKAQGPAPLDKRMQAARQVMDHPKVKITDLEASLGSPYTAKTIASLQRLYPRVQFVWLMGADNMVQLNRWQDWQAILQAVPVAVLARAGQRLGARRSVAARMYRGARMTGRSVHGLGGATAPAWAYVNVPLVKLSSTQIRSAGDWR